MTDLELLKKSVRADDFDSDDELLSHLLDASMTYVTDATGRSASELAAMGTDGMYPPDLRQAVVMLAGHWYNQREAAAGSQMTEVPFGVTAIIKRYRKLSKSE
jgi:uncharacterized phage protein (predicted DNA packaging)